MPREYTSTGNYELPELKITSHKGIKYRLDPIFVQLQIFEDLFSTNLSAMLMLADPFNLISNLPIVGGEKISVKWKTLGKQDKNHLEFVVYKISKRQETSLKSQTYWIHLTTSDKLKSDGVSMSKAVQGTASDLVPAILADIGSTRPTFIDEALGVNNWVIPRWSPFTAIKQITSCAYDRQNGPILFYETVDGYHMKSLYDLMSSNDTIRMQLHPVRTKDHPTKLESHRQRSFDGIDNLQILDSADIQRQVSNGAFGSSQINFDFNHKTWNQTDFSYSESFTKESSIDTHPLYIPEDFELSNVRYSETCESGSHLRSQERDSILSLISNKSIRCMANGDSDLRVGQVVDFSLPSLEPSKEEYIEENLTSGRFLISSLRHVLSTKGYTVSMEWLKDSNGTDFERITGEIG